MAIPGAPLPLRERRLGTTPGGDRRAGEAAAEIAEDYYLGIEDIEVAALYERAAAVRAGRLRTRMAVLRLTHIRLMQAGPARLPHLTAQSRHHLCFNRV